MKKVMILLTVSCLICGLALAGGKGAVKADMVVHTDSGEYMGKGTVVGSVNLNTTAAGFLIVVVNLDDAVVLEGDDLVYDSLVHINGKRILSQVAVDCLKVNANGQGTANYKVDLTVLVDDDGNPIEIPDDATDISVNVVVRPSFSPDLTTPCYVNGPAWKTNIIVPLK